MLQQTQVSRVEEKYERFLQKFPTIQRLAIAQTKDVLKEWQGLGYNRRAFSLKRLSEIIVKTNRGKIPEKSEELLRLPGVGPATAGAIMAFAWNAPSVFIETNIRRAYIHEWFKRKKKVTDTEVLLLVEQTFDKKNPREWYYALMDYGSMLGKKLGKDNPNKRSRKYLMQTPFLGSNREARGRIVSLLLERDRTLGDLRKACDVKNNRFLEALKALVSEGAVIEKRNKFSIAK